MEDKSKKSGVTIGPIVPDASLKTKGDDDATKTKAEKDADTKEFLDPAKVADVIYEEQRTSTTPKTGTVANIDTGADQKAREAQAMEVSQNWATSQSITKDDHGRPTNPNDVKFYVEYGSFKGVQHMPDKTIIVVSKEVAEQFTDLGIGYIVE